METLVIVTTKLKRKSCGEEMHSYNVLWRNSCYGNACNVNDQTRTKNYVVRKYVVLKLNRSFNWYTIYPYWGWDNLLYISAHCPLTYFQQNYISYLLNILYIIVHFVFLVNITNINYFYLL